MPIHRRSLVAALVASLFLATPAVHAAHPGALRVLVTNDDGVGAPGIDALVTALSANPNLDITVIAPATNQSGTGDKLTAGPIDVTPASTAGAFPARAVAGFPADSSVFGIRTMNPPPDLVVSGINLGQNIAELSTLSGTVGAALWAARLGVPAFAVSQGFGPALSYTDAANYTAQLVEKFRVNRGFRAKLTTRFSDRKALVVNINFPTCAGAGTRRGIELVPLGRITTITSYTLQSTMGSTQRFAPVNTSSSLSSDCTSTLTKPVDDVAAMGAGFASVTVLNPDSSTSDKQRGYGFLVRP
ncbi:MAG TPA: 5'/3'-nucleotidase SurE [Candidatus Binatia bacterium]|jgi:5'-nucleotidase|nr:5'/3'-nucleotidase SurE [Candidatus Binatia bacterium]